MDAVVQLLRNAFCCVKDLHLFPTTVLYDVSYTAFLNLPTPLNKTTPLEIAIAITQFYAFVSVSMSGYRLMTDGGTKKLRRIEKLLQNQSKIKKNADETAQNLVIERLEKEKESARLDRFVGALVMSIGLAFFWLVGNSFHVTETDWIGGLPALILALSVMEIALLPLLYYMVMDAVGLLGKAAVMEYLAKILRKCKNGVPSVILTDESFSILLQKGWNPFWAGKSAVDVDETAEEKKLLAEASSIVSELESWTQDKDKGAMKAKIQETASRLETDAVTVRLEAYRQIVYFILNGIAFYGYMLGILVYFLGENEGTISIRGVKLGMSNSEAEWSGNFAGDFAWTIEPIVILFSPPLFTLLKPKTLKSKID